MLYQKILNKLDEQRGLSDDLAKVAGYNSGQALRKALKENREFGSFYGLIKLVRELFPNEETKLIQAYSEEVDPNKQTARYLLEWCDINELRDVKRNLVDRMLTCSNIVSREWAEVFNIDLKYADKVINFVEALGQLGQVKTKTVEMEILISIYKAYCYVDKQMYEMSYQVTLHIDSLFAEIKEEYIYKLLRSRYLLIVAEYHLRKNEKQVARGICEEIIEIADENAVKCFGLMQLGNSLILEDYEKSNRYLIEGLELALQKTLRNSIDNIRRSLNFLDNIWKRNPRYLSHESTNPSDIHEVVFGHINENNYAGASEVMGKLEVDKLNNNQKAFHYYLKGLISNEISDYCKSVKYFTISKDIHFRELPLIELKKLNINDDILEVLGSVS